MKNTIKYFYNIEIEDIRQIGNKYIFDYMDNKYSFENCTDYIQYMDEIYKLNKFMVYNKLPVYQIVTNKFNEVITNVNEVSYILMLIDNNYDLDITIDDLFLYQFKTNINSKLKVNEWKILWVNKIDYFEYQINQFGIKYPLIRESMGYFVGMAENAISMFDKSMDNDLYLQHRRIRNNSKQYDFLNPLNIIIDTRSRDISEFYKSYFIEEKDKDNKINIINYLVKYNYNEEELYLFYVRMFFPTFYFDKYEKIVNDTVEEEKIKKTIDKVNDYQLFLKELTLYLNQYISIPNVEWIKK